MFIYPHMYRKLKRGPQVILPKDIGIIMAYSGVNKNSVCVDAGTGSGWLAVGLAMVCKQVYSYELREDFIAIAEKNKQMLGLDNITFKNKDVLKKIDEKDVDLVTLDLPGSEKALKNAYKALKPGGMVVGYLPHTEQVKAFVEKLNKTGFSDAHTVEVIVRDLLVRKEGVRPTNTGLWHTAYLTFARK
ncbi:MAG TPA: methyltransferase domain-containing protein [Candidatus Saccharimonadales bacterium]|nr:methyltransferase domain-containing protein [Candidatus Saccharimonadales bacterium]